MFNLQGSEIIFILLIALVVLGPEKLPDTIRRFTKTYGELKKMGAGFESELRSVMEEPAREVRETAGLLRDVADPDKLASRSGRTPLDADEPPEGAEGATAGDGQAVADDPMVDEDATVDGEVGDGATADEPVGDANGDGATADEPVGDANGQGATVGNANGEDATAGAPAAGDPAEPVSGDDLTSGAVEAADRSTDAGRADDGDHADAAPVPDATRSDPDAPAAEPAPSRPVNRIAAANSSAALAEAAAAANGARSGDRAGDDDPSGAARGGRDADDDAPVDASHESDADDVAERGDRAART